MTASAHDNIVLIGYRGCGKSTVGQLLARHLGRPFVDTDALIEQQVGVSITEFFAVAGETVFRRREVGVIAAITQQSGQVIAVGGGAVMDPQNASRLKATGSIIWLTAPAEVLWERISQDQTSEQNRPNLTAAGGLAEVRDLLAQREPTYRKLADQVLNTTDLTVAQVVERCLPQAPDP